MMYPYISFPGVDNLGDIEVTHSQVVTKNSVQTVEVHFERATKTGFETARCELPLYKWIVRDGFSDVEIKGSKNSYKEMFISFLNLLQEEVFLVPSLFRIGKYLVFFWSNENNEPLHVHISEGHPTPSL